MPKIPQHIGFSTVHPTYGQADAVFTAIATWSPEKNLFHIEATAAGTLTCWATAKANNLVNPDTAKATAGITNMELDCGPGKISFLKNWTATAEATSTVKKTKAIGSPQYSSHKHNTHDPVTLTLVEEETGQKWSQELFKVDITDEDRGNVGYTFDNSVGGAGVLLSCSPEETIDMEGHSSGSWLVSPYGEFSASLSGGQFTASGVWASMPWELVHADPQDLLSSVLSAYLPSDYVSPSSDMSYQLPDDLYREGYNYDLSWDSTASTGAEATDYDVITPEPATLLLLGTGALGLFGFIRRQRMKK